MGICIDKVSLRKFKNELNGQFGGRCHCGQFAPVSDGVTQTIWTNRWILVGQAARRQCSITHHLQNLVQVFGRPPELFKLLEPLITADSIQFANYEEGRRRRRVYDKAFSHAAISQYYSSFQKVAEEVSLKWAASSNTDDQIPLQKHMIDLAIKAIALTAFGECFEDSENINRLQNSYDLVWEVIEESLTVGFPEPGTDRYKRFQTGKSTIYRIVEEVIQHKQLERARDDKVLFIDYLMSLDSPINLDRVFADGLSYMIGGFHTTGNMLTWALYFLACDQDAQEKLATEIQTVLGGDNVNPTNINNLTYLRQVQEETLRCSVVASWAAKFLDDDVELGGYLIQKRTPIITALGVMLQDEKYWPDPTRFDPERFSAENMKKRQGHVFSPFGLAGKRICPGYRFAYVETAVVLATLVGRFCFKLVEDQNIKPVFGPVTHVSEEVWIKVAKR
ncbi:cytochrome P450 20A1-like [Liolophura sinensis]|uniref:cytochrome P450 20A1-like n=1 Tax=Liolophura sinensis TaxID=3198878 RepID=UPI0031595331